MFTTWFGLESSRNPRSFQNVNDEMNVFPPALLLFEAQGNIPVSAGRIKTKQ
jgi:hypothetical protein